MTALILILTVAFPDSSAERPELTDLEGVWINPAATIRIRGDRIEELNAYGNGRFAGLVEARQGVFAILGRERISRYPYTLDGEVLRLDAGGGQDVTFRRKVSSP